MAVLVYARSARRHARQSLGLNASKYQDRAVNLLLRKAADKFPRNTAVKN